MYAKGNLHLFKALRNAALIGMNWLTKRTAVGQTDCPKWIVHQQFVGLGGVFLSKESQQSTTEFQKLPRLVIGLTYELSPCRGKAIAELPNETAMGCTSNRDDCVACSGADD